MMTDFVVQDQCYITWIDGLFSLLPKIKPLISVKYFMWPEIWSKGEDNLPRNVCSRNEYRNSDWDELLRNSGRGTSS